MNLGPLLSRINHLEELKPLSSDKVLLQQSTKHRDRIFIKSKQEKTKILELLNGGMFLNDFVETSEIRSE